MAMTRIPLALLALALGLSSACGSYSAPSNMQNPPPPTAAANDISIAIGASGLTTTAFTPNPKVVSLGGNSSVSVRWVNKDISGGDYVGGTATTHNIASDNGAFATSGALGGNGTYSVTFTAAGSYPYHCAIHPNMVGTVTVNP
jgi:plastocyanin